MAAPAVGFHDPDELQEAFNPGGYRVEVWQAQGESVVDYYLDEVHVAMFVLRMVHDGGAVWTRAWVAPEYQGRGIYTHLVKWMVTQPSSVIEAVGEQTEMYERSGYKETEPGRLEMEPSRAKKWLKGR